MASWILAMTLTAAALPPLPEPVTNNAVAKVTLDDTPWLLSFNGVGQGKTYQQVHDKTWGIELVNHGQWQSLAPVPGPGRLASVAIGVGKYAYLFGGYTVDAKHNEVSLPDVYRYDLKTDSYTELAPMPVPVDDSVVLSFQQRYLYLVSGWHNDGNVNLVQMYDIKTNEWKQASPFPGKPVFGHAGAIAGNTMVICDGVGMTYPAEQRRGFKAEPACYQGKVEHDDPTKIQWQALPHHSGVARYRMAAVARPERAELWFIGGSVTPYNYDGIGYDGIPADPSHRISVFDMVEKRWRNEKSIDASMDHRGAIKLGKQLVILGGMGEQQTVLNKVRVLD